MTGNRECVCVVCGITFWRWTRPGIYCTQACMAIAYRERMSGTGNPAWRGGKWKYKGRHWSEIAAGVIAEAGRCADCGTADNLLAHHVIPQRFWIDLDRANARGNLLTLCTSCHPKRPEHYWKILPDTVYIEGVHIRQPGRREGSRLLPYPTCAICGESCKTRRARYCSYTCSNRARWQGGIYGPELARNITRTRWESR